MTQEELVKSLSTPTNYLNPELLLEWINPNESGFSRTLKITTNYGFQFQVIWYPNLLTIHIGEVRMWAEILHLSSTYPRESKLDIRAMYKGIDFGLSIPAIL